MSCLSELASHLTVLGVLAHAVSDSTSNLSGGLHDHIEASLEIVPEVELLKLELLLSGDGVDTFVEGTKDTSSGGDFGLASDLADGGEDGSSRLHDHAESLLEAFAEVTPEGEILELRWVLSLELLESMNSAHLGTDIGDLAPAILGVEIVDGVGGRSPVLFVVVV